MVAARQEWRDDGEFFLDREISLRGWLGRTSRYERILVEHERFTLAIGSSLRERLVHHKRKGLKLSSSRANSKRAGDGLRVLTRTFVVSRHALDDAGEIATSRRTTFAPAIVNLGALSIIISAVLVITC